MINMVITPQQNCSLTQGQWWTVSAENRDNFKWAGTQLFK